jgi:hypothetical protein
MMKRLSLRRIKEFNPIRLLLLSGLLTIWSWALPRLTEPTYDGKPLSGWIRDGGHQFDDAIKEMGTECLPDLVQAIRQRGSKTALLKSKLISWHSQWWHSKHPCRLDPWHSRDNAVNQNLHRAFQILGPIADPAVPELTALLNEPHTQYLAGRALAAIGTSGWLPLRQALISQDGYLRLAAVEALRTYQGNPEPVVPAVSQLLDDPWAPVRVSAAMTLPHLKGSSKTAVPALAVHLNDSDPTVVWAILMALADYGDDAKLAMPALKKYLSQPVQEPYLQTMATSKLNRLLPIPDETPTQSDLYQEVRSAD